MKLLRNFLGLLACTAGLAGSAMADDPPSVSLPEDVKALAPAAMIPIFYSEMDSDAALIVQTKDDHPDNPSHDPYAHPQTRWLIMFRKEHGSYKEVDRSDKIIACSTCGEDGEDPFFPEGIELKNGRLDTQQDTTIEPSTADYQFSYDPKLGHWIVTSASTTEVDQNFSEGPLTHQKPQKIPLPTPPLLANFDPGWQPREPMLAFSADESGENTYSSSADTERLLDVMLKADCENHKACKVLVKQVNGCAALVKDGGQLFVGKSSVKLDGAHDDDAKKKEALDQAMSACKSGGGSTCQVIRNECT